MDVNYLAIVIAGVASIFLGFVWYSKFLFGAVWMKLAGITDEKMKKTNSNMPVLYGTMMVGSLVMIYVLKMFLNISNATDLMEGMKVAIWLWLGFVATVSLSNVLFEGRPVKLFAINSGFQLVNLLIATVILLKIV